MSRAVGLKEVQGRAEPSVAKLDEAVWQAWLTKGRMQGRRSFEARMRAVKWASIATLLAAAGLWSQLAPYEGVIRFLVIGGAAVVMFQAFEARRYAFAGVFAALVLLYNPVAVAFYFSGDWQRAFVLVSAIPFALSLTWRSGRLEQ